MKRFSTIIAAGCLYFLVADPAMALDMEFFTYGGFDPVTEAFTKIALIFSDSAYQGLLFVVTVLGLLAGVSAWLVRAANEGVNKMEDLIRTFVKGNGYGKGDLAHSVDSTIADIRDRVQGHEFKHNIGMAANDAGAKTFSIRKENFAKPNSDATLDNPNGEAVTNPADDVRRRNLQEESGTGRIHTNALDIAKDIAGLNKEKSLRPTDEFYRNQTFYYGGTLIQPQKHQEGIVLPSGTVIYGDAEYTPPQKDEDFFKGSVFEKK